MGWFISEIIDHIFIFSDHTADTGIAVADEDAGNHVAQRDHHDLVRLVVTAPVGGEADPVVGARVRGGALQGGVGRGAVERLAAGVVGGMVLLVAGISLVLIRKPG